MLDPNPLDELSDEELDRLSDNEFFGLLFTEEYVQFTEQQNHIAATLSSREEKLRVLSASARLPGALWEIPAYQIQM